MSLNSTGAARRRRGAALEEALLDAAWTELTERGYDDMTIEAVAVRAGTSRAVLYRRWPNKQELVLAALEHEVRKDVVVAPDTGSLRGDVIELLQQICDAMPFEHHHPPRHLGGVRRKDRSNGNVPEPIQGFFAGDACRPHRTQRSQQGTALRLSGKLQRESAALAVVGLGEVDELEVESKGSRQAVGLREVQRANAA